MNDDLLERLDLYSVSATLYSQEISNLLKEAAAEIKRLMKQIPPEGHIAYYLPYDVVEQAKGSESALYYHLANAIALSVSDNS